MHIITRKRLNDFAEKFPETENAATRQYRENKQNNFSNLVELQELLPSAADIKKLPVFNIGGNKVRLIAAIHYNRRKV